MRRGPIKFVTDSDLKPKIINRTGLPFSVEVYLAGILLFINNLP